MGLRFEEDRRSLLWAFVLLPLAPALALWRPALLPWLAPFVLYCSYLSGVLTHNHVHSPLFRGRNANLAYGAWLGIFYGFPTFSWLPTHNDNHHRFRNAEGDASRTEQVGKDSLLTALLYPLLCARYQLPLVWGFARRALSRSSRQRTRVIVESATLGLGHVAALALCVSLRGAVVGGAVYGFAIGLPALLGTYWMMLTNYFQHVGCDAGSEHDHSRNFVSPFFNWFVFDNGLHTVHHEHPGQHWSHYRALHDARAGQIAPALNQGFLPSYLLYRYFSARGRADVAAAEIRA